MARKKVAFIGDPLQIGRVFGDSHRQRLSRTADVYPQIITSDSLERGVRQPHDIEALFSTWGMMSLTDQQLAAFPSLKALFYAAGSVKAFAAPLLQRKIIVSSAWAANAVPVAQVVLAQILLGLKGYFRNTRQYARPDAYLSVYKGPGILRGTVALLGCGRIARRVMELLKPHGVEILVVDPYLSDADAETLRVRRVSLEEAFGSATVVSNHLPNLEATRAVIRGRHFESMRDSAVFINTGRGAQVAEQEMIDVLLRRPDLTALLDVTDPEPPAAGSPLYTMPNVRLSTHIAGSIGTEVERLADCAIDEYERWLNGSPLKCAVTADMLDLLA